MPIDKQRSRVLNDSFDTMWAFLQMGGQKSDIPGLREHCESLRRMMMQKTAGQRKDKPKDESFDDIWTLCELITLETMCLYLSGDLDRLEEHKNED